MKKRFLPFSLLLVIMILGQSMSIADNGGHYVPRTQGTPTAERFMSELRVNQHTGLIDPAMMLKATQSVSKDGPVAPNESLYWLSMGPDNMGGQTTAIVYDNKKNSHGNPNGVVYIGSKGGGVYKTYNYGITWHQVGGKDLMVSCMAQDAEGNIYVGTGDGNNNISYNGLDQQGYDNSFIGGGIYKIDANDAITLLEATAPAANDDAEGWAFVNDIVVMGNTIVAATNGGLMYSNDKGQSWRTALESKCEEVKTTANNTLVVSSEGSLYIGSIDDLVCHSASSIQYDDDDNIIALPTAAGLLDVATAPSDANTIYAAVVKADGVHTGIYVSFDNGETWKVALPATTSTFGHNVYEDYGIYNHGLVVDPSSNGIVYVLGYNLWKLQRPESGEGFYITEQVTNGGASYYYLTDYLHVGLHTMVFNPNNAKECYIGTDGGIYKATLKSNAFTFSNCNRNYITTRMFNVAMSGTDTHILAAGLDHGTVLIEGNPDVNTMGYAEWINPTGYNDGLYAEEAQAGPCAISAINANTIFVTYMDNGEGKPTVTRSDKAGQDWISTNFLDSLSISSSSFRLPILLFEDYDDEANVDVVWFKNTTEATMPSGTTVQCMSNNAYPFDYRLTAALAVDDSIAIHDPISSRLYVAFTDAVYVTRMPLQFATSPSWYCVADKSHSNFKGEPLSFGISADGDNLWVGMKDGKLYRISNLNTVVDYASGTITNPSFQVTTTEVTMPTTQCVTSIAVDPRDANKVVVTLGNYGNDNYVLYSSNGLADEPTFDSKQANLPKMPVYSSVIEMSTGHVILGTERGIYKTTNIGSANWIADSQMLGEVPVMDLKQQLLSQEDRYVVLASPEDTVVNLYPGVHNTGIIYAATYGKGVYRCENYKLSATDVPENPVVMTEMTVSIFPNPAHEQATVKFETEGNANVSYQVFDLTGRMVMQQNLGRMAEGSYEINVNTSNLSTGSYILRLSEGSRTSSVKFLVF
jgi:sugar lactone lactonase YvrE